MVSCVISGSSIRSKWMLVGKLIVIYSVAEFSASRAAVTR